MLKSSAIIGTAGDIKMGGSTPTADTGSRNAEWPCGKKQRKAGTWVRTATEPVQNLISLTQRRRGGSSWNESSFASLGTPVTGCSSPVIDSLPRQRFSATT